VLVPTGMALALPEGYVALVHPRSGLAARHGLSIVNTPGTIDSGYRGEIKVLLINHDPEQPIKLRRGDRIAQLVVQRYEHARFVAVDELPESARGAGGYGSTGGFATGETPAEEKQ
jgi:dUTP pyrophosphatase